MPFWRKKLRFSLLKLPKLPNAESSTRITFLETQVKSVLEKTVTPGWHCVRIADNAADYALYKNGDLEQISYIHPTNAAAHSGFYELAFLRATIEALSAEQQTAVGKFLRPKSYDGNLENTPQFADIEDVYRVLTYLRRLKK